MFTVILFVILSIVFGYFATQNTQDISITLAGSEILGLPLYLVIGVTLVLGLSFSWLVSLLDSFSTTLKMRGKESTIKDANKTIQELTKQVNDLEIENANLKGKIGGEVIDSESL